MSETVKSMIKACIVSRKGGLPLCDINKDYKDLVGENIPYAALGYRSLEDFLKSINFVNITRQFAGDAILKVSDPKVSHIENMINKQKNPKHKGKNKRCRYYKKDRVQPDCRADNNHLQSSNRANNNNRQFDNRPNNNHVQFDNNGNYRAQPNSRANINRPANFNPPRRNESPPNVAYSRTETFGGNMRAEYAQSKWCPYRPNAREISRQARTENRQTDRFNNFNVARMGIQPNCETSPRTYYGNPWDYQSHFAYMASKEQENMYYYQAHQQMRFADDISKNWGYQNTSSYAGNAPVAYW